MGYMFGGDLRVARVSCAFGPAPLRSGMAGIRSIGFHPALSALLDPKLSACYFSRFTSREAAICNSPGRQPRDCQDKWPPSREAATRWTVARASRLLCHGRRSIHFQFCYQQQVDNAESVIGMMDDDRSTARRLGKEFAVRDMARRAVGHTNGERPKRLDLVHVAKLFNGHGPVSDA